jgi:hypothetical protein
MAAASQVGLARHIQQLNLALQLLNALQWSPAVGVTGEHALVPQLGQL